MKKILILLAISFSIANAGFLKHAAAIGVGYAVGHAAGKAIDYGTAAYQKKESVNSKNNDNKNSNKQ